MAAKAKASLAQQKTLSAVDRTPRNTSNGSLRKTADRCQSSPSTGLPSTSSGPRSCNSTGSTTMPPADSAGRSEEAAVVDGTPSMPACAKSPPARPRTTGCVRSGTQKLPPVRGAAGNPRAKTAAERPRGKITGAGASAPSAPAPKRSAQQLQTASRGSCGGPRATIRAADRAEIEMFCRLLFKMADENHTETIQFAEFVVLHRALMTVAGDLLSDCDLKVMTDQELEKQFRAVDENHNMSLDFEEWGQYLEGLLSVLGIRNFLKVCGTVVEEESQRKQELKDTFDDVASARLLDRVKKASSLVGQEQAVLDCQHLLSRRADPSATEPDGTTSLCYAAEKGDRNFVLSLLVARADANAANEEQECPCFFAARARNLEVLRVLLIPPKGNNFATVDRADNVEVSRNLVKSISHLSNQEIRDLIHQQADVNYKDEHGWTALSSAVFWGKKEAVEIILRQGSALGRMTRLNTQNTKGRSALHLAARKGRVELVPLLVPARADVDLQDIDGWTPLHHATFNGNDSTVESLIKAGASPVAVAHSGFTPYMIASLPSCAGQLRESTLKLIEPDEEVNFTKRILPILNEQCVLFDKVEALQSLPTVNFNWKNLRLYEQYFHGRIGPNKVRLAKTYECLVRDLIRRLRTDETDCEEPGPHLSDERNIELTDECQRRRKDQRNFLKTWFEDTMGPPISADWQWESRESYRQELEDHLAQEVDSYRERFNEAYARLREQDCGVELCNLPEVEVLRKELLLQTGAHAILPWLDTLSIQECFDALRRLKVCGMGKEEDESLMSFMDLICMNSEFESGKLFWQNVYKLWLLHFGQLVQSDFHQKIKGIVALFNSNHESEGYSVTIKMAAPKTYESMKRKERSLFESRRAADQNELEMLDVASGILDVTRMSLMPNCPAAAMKLLDTYLRPISLKENRMALVQIINGFNPDASSNFGYRDIVLNVFYDGGIRSTPCGRPNLQHHLAHVVELQIVFAEFIQEKKRMHLVRKFLDGDFDRQQLSERDAEHAETARSRGSKRGSIATLEEE